MNEETTTAAVDGTPTNPSWKMFDVPTDVFRRFEVGRNKFERWSKFLDVEDAAQNEILNYAKKNKDNTIVLRDSTNGALRAIRRRASNH